MPAGFPLDRAYYRSRSKFLHPQGPHGSTSNPVDDILHLVPPALFKDAGVGAVGPVEADEWIEVAVTLRSSGDIGPEAVGVGGVAGLLLDIVDGLPLQIKPVGLGGVVPGVEGQRTVASPRHPCLT